MFLRSLKLTNFRNYEFLEADFCGGINCITGNNGEGKTNVLESIHFLSQTRGFVGKSERYALREGENFFFSEGLFESTDVINIQCNYLSNKGKKMIFNGKPVARMSDHIGKIPLISCQPDDTQLIHGTSTGRRKFIDSFISQYDHGFLENLIQYDRALKQKNAQLSQFLESGSYKKELLEIWEEKMIPAGQKIWESRNIFLEEFGEDFQFFFKHIVSSKENTEIIYESSIVNNTVSEWNDGFEKLRDRERYSGRTQYGVHKDDLKFIINGKEAKNYGSQGQQKTFVISLKFAQAKMLHTKRGIAPVLLLDDIFDKLDYNRLESIAEILEKELEGQVFITDTSYERSEKVFYKSGKKDVSLYELKDQVLRRKKKYEKKE